MSEAGAQPHEPVPDDADAADLFRLDDRSFRIAVFAILALAAGLRLWAIDFGLPHPRTRPDEYAVVELSAIPLDGKLDVGWPVYPHTYIYTLAAWGGLGVQIGQLLGWVEEGSYRELLEKDRSSVYLILRLLSAAVGTLAVWLSIRLAAMIFSRPVALGTGLLVATNFLQNRESHTIKPDILLSAAILVAFFFIVPLAQRATARRGIHAGLAAAAAIGAKYPGVMIAPAVYFAAIMGSGSGGSLRRLFPAPGLLAAVATAGLFLATNPYVFISPSSVATWQSLARANLPMFFEEATEADAQSLGAIGAGKGGFEELERLGNLPSFEEKPWWDGFAFHTRFSLRYGLGAIATLLAPFALGWALVAGATKRRAFTLPAAVFIVGYFGLFSISPAQMSRYMTPLVPILLMLELAMLAQGVAWLAGRSAGIRRAAPILVIGLALVLGGESAARTWGHNRIAAAEDTRNLATRWLEENTPRHARIKILGTLFMPYGRPLLPPGRWGSLAPAEIEALTEDRVSYVLTHEHALFASTVDPAEFAAIASRLDLLVEFDPYEGGAGHPEDIVYEMADAYYIPTAGFANQRRPGPRVRIYAFRTSP